MKKISKQAVRSKAVENVLASLRIEQLTPGDYVVRGLNACLNGQMTTPRYFKRSCATMLPMSSVTDIASVPGELFAKFQHSFYLDPVDAVFKALGVE